PFEELTRCSLLNRIAQPHKLIYSLICPHIMLAFKIVHRRGADRTPHCLTLIKHREINDHPIEVVAQYFTSLQRHCKSSVLKGSDNAVCGGLSSPRAEGRSRLAFAPCGREPRLLVARKSRRAVVVSHLEEPGSSKVIAPGVEFEEAAIAAIAKALLVVSSWV